MRYVPSTVRNVIAILISVVCLYGCTGKRVILFKPPLPACAALVAELKEYPRPLNLDDTLDVLECIELLETIYAPNK